MGFRIHKKSIFWSISLEYFVGWAQTSHFCFVSHFHCNFFLSFFLKIFFFTIFRIPQIQRPPSSTKSFWNHARIPMGWCGPVHWFWKEIVSITKQKKSLCPRSPYVEYWRYVKYIKRWDYYLKSIHSEIRNVVVFSCGEKMKCTPIGVFEYIMNKLT